jgi:hypothetical protein
MLACIRQEEKKSCESRPVPLGGVAWLPSLSISTLYSVLCTLYSVFRIKT